jgi:hypothetical protein
MREGGGSWRGRAWLSHFGEACKNFPCHSQLKFFFRIRSLKMSAGARGGAEARLLLREGLSDLQRPKGSSTSRLREIVSSEMEQATMRLTASSESCGSGEQHSLLFSEFCGCRVVCACEFWVRSVLKFLLWSMRGDICWG